LGPTVGFYGGINYGFGYFGNGFYGGRWEGGHFFYNTSVWHVGDGFHKFTTSTWTYETILTSASTATVGLTRVPHRKKKLPHMKDISGR